MILSRKESKSRKTYNLKVTAFIFELNNTQYKVNTKPSLIIIQHINPKIFIEAFHRPHTGKEFKTVLQINQF